MTTRPPTRPLRLGTRRSPLALAQAEEARECLLAAERSENATVRQVASKLRARLDKPSAD